MKIINISYRLPISFVKKENEIKIQTSPGGLVSAVQSLQGGSNQICWVGIADFTHNDWLVGKELYQGNIDLHPIFLEKNINHNFYHGFSNSVLWPLFHYFPSYVEYKQEYIDSYIEANQIVAEQLLPIVGKDDIIWIHDYHLIPLAGYIRKLIPHAKIGFFLHIPFPSYELIRLLPKDCRDVLIKNLLGADLIGFHTYDYAQHFVATVQMIEGLQHKHFQLQYQDREINVGAYPISIDFEKFNNPYQDQAVIDERTKFKELYADKKIIFSVDRLDYTKGVVFRLNGYAQFLEENPEWKEKIVFILVVVPSRDSINKYEERKQIIEQLISQINGKFGNFRWSPIVYQYSSVNFAELMGLYTSCDIALISPLRDGMNLVAKEFVASRQDQQGVLLLSDMTGAAKELTDSLLFNPLDKNEIAQKIKIALAMPADEQRSRMVASQNQIKVHNVFKWANDFVGDLQIITKDAKTTTLLHDASKIELINLYEKANKRLILLDYDGTLVDFHAEPQLAKPSEMVLDLLQKLAQNPQNQVAIVSGRDKETLDKWLGHLPLVLIAEHGAYAKNGTWQAHIKHRQTWKDGVKNIMQNFADNCNGAFVEEKKYAICWHYRNAHSESGFAQSRELVSVLSDYLISTNANIIDGNKVIEVKPVQINKGVIAEQTFDIKNYDFCLAIGDDKTDEDMFETINKYKGITIKVGNAASIAKFRLETLQQVFSFLELLK